MTLIIAAILSALIGLIALQNWRKALFMLLLIGLLQDPLRKLTPGIPSYFIIWSAALYFMIIAVAMASRDLAPLNRIYLRSPALRTAWTVFGLLVGLQLIIAFLRWGSIAVPIFGAIFYIGPVLAMLLGYSLANNERNMLGYLKTYLFLFVPAALTIYLSPSFQDSWTVLREIGSFEGRELIIYDVGTILKSYSGIFRVGEIAAWHAATAASFLILLAIIDRNPIRRVLYLVLIVALVGAVVYTGRRKMLMTLTIFLASFWALSARYRGGGRTITLLVLVLGVMLSYSLTLLDPASESALYIERSSTVFGAVGERAEGSFQLFKSAFQRSGGLGLGAGASSQGIGYAGVDTSSAVGGAGEAGIGKLMLELGVFGILSIAALLLLTARQLIRGMRRLLQVSQRLFIYQCGFQSILFANLMTFTVATQVYGDFFILLVLGTIGGFVVRLFWIGVNMSIPGEPQTNQHQLVIGQNADTHKTGTHPLGIGR